VGVRKGSEKIESRFWEGGGCRVPKDISIPFCVLL
jgi:hypothetical protein